MATAERVAIRQAEAVEDQAQRLASLEKSVKDLHSKVDSLIGFLVPSEPEDDKSKAKK